MHLTRHFHRSTHPRAGTRSARKSPAPDPASDSFVNHLILPRGRPLFEAYKENIRSDSDRERLSVVFPKLYGYTIAPEAVYCDGCLEPDENNPWRLATETCPIRDCVLEKKIPYCGKCSTFPCELMERHLAPVETVISKAREILTPEEYQNFVEPYLSREFLSGKSG
jgi:hypothetical protein